MIIYYLIIYIMLISSLVIFIMSLYLMLIKMTVFVEVEMMGDNSVTLDYLILVDWMSLMFISVVLLITSMVIIYSFEYMLNDYYIKRFFFLIILFVISMIMLIISPNIVSILIGWDGLGLVSYCLIIYYQNFNSYNSGMVTILTNRVGDIMILMLIGLMMSIGSWSIMYLKNMDIYLIMLVVVAAFTKSAQIPFSSWLPLAMAAPTPVSSLVHSSTLVTAGVYLLIRFNYLMENSVILNFMMYISILTLLMSGLSANFENDLKKIIALSTLSQLGVMIFCLSMMMFEVSFFHLLTHAMFKSMLFMCAGVIIHNMLGNQDIRCISMIFFNMPLISVIFNCSTFSLCGLPFLSGFFSKDLILELYLMNSMNKFMLMLLFISMGLTVMYSIRLMSYSFIKFSNLNIYMNYKSLSSLMSYSMFFLFFMSVIIGSILSWLMFSMKNLIYLTFKFKMLIYFFMLMGIFMVMIISMMKFSIKFFIKTYNIMKFMMMMWFIPEIMKNNINHLFEISFNLIYFIDGGWNENLCGMGVINYFKKIFYLDIYNKKYFYLFIFISYFLIVLISVWGGG